ncbi:MAG: transposase [Saprospiraceae bacterium]|nr:transposase [Lewinellaceae bacterium]
MSKYYYQGSKLPHWQPPEGTFFVTMRLFGSVPKNIIQALKASHQVALLEARQANCAPEEAEKLLPEELKVAVDRIRKKKEYEAGKRYFASFDDFLDSNLNEPHWLRQPEVAQLNAENLHFYAEKYFDLWAYTIMSNHIHLLLTLRPGAPILWKVLQDLKKYSGLHSNRLLGRSGSFWEEESYDHLVREPEEEFNRIAAYVLNNPVKAGIVTQWQAHPWTYCHPEL